MNALASGVTHIPMEFVFYILVKSSAVSMAVLLFFLNAHIFTDNQHFSVHSLP